MQEYLKLPIRFQHFFERRKLPTCSLKESIMYNLHLLITTTLEENKQDLEYGSQFWEQDFDIHLSNDARRETVISSLKKQLALYEKRLTKVSLEVNVKQTEHHVGGDRQLRRRIELIITGAIVRSNEPFRFQTGFFIGPLAYD